VVCLLALAGALFVVPAARAAGAPLIGESWVEEVTADSARLRATINPEGLPSTYRFEVVSQGAFEKAGYAGAVLLPPSGKAPLGSGTTFLSVAQTVGPPLNPLLAQTAYRYRVSATNEGGSAAPIEHLFTTQPSELQFGLPDHRAWELVSPPEKGGGSIAAPGAIFGGGDFQASPSSSSEGAALTYGSASAFGEAQGAPPGSQYLSRRTGTGWITANVSAPLSSAAYGAHPDGAPYRLFSASLSAGLLFGGLPCRGALAGCPAPTPVLPESGAPPGYMAYYLRNGGTGAFSSLLGAGDLAHTAIPKEDFEVAFAGATSDLSRIVLSSCAALTVDAIEAPGCAAQNLYEWSGGVLRALNLLPGDAETTPGATLAAPLGAISDDGQRVYMYQLEDGPIYLREGAQSKQIAGTIGESASFQLASSDGRYAFYTKNAHLYRWDAQSEVSTDLTPAGGLLGVFGASEDGAIVYFEDAGGIERWEEGQLTHLAPGSQLAAASDFPPATGTARVSADGSHLAFLSAKDLGGYDSGGRTELYLYGPQAGGSPQLICASCNPTGERARGSATIPGALVNGSTRAYRPRILTADAHRIFFESNDRLVPGDANDQPDVYQWEADGEGSCTLQSGCLSLISSGAQSSEATTFIDASADGADVYFLTDSSLVPSDPGSVDIYDAREEGGFPEPSEPLPCVADACQPLPPTPEDPEPGSLVPNVGNLPLHVEHPRRPHRPHHHKRPHHAHRHSHKGPRR
jgi:hypothetical protein